MTNKLNRLSLASHTGFCWLLTLSLTAYLVHETEGVHAGVPSDFVVNYDQGYDAGYLLGYDYGLDQGFSRGTNEGAADGETQGYDDGWAATYDPAYQTSYDHSLTIGKTEGFADAFPTAAEEGYQWASELHRYLIQPDNYETLTNTYPAVTELVLRWGDPSDWGSTGRSSGITISHGGVNWGFLKSPSDETEWATFWAAHYHDEGYDHGYKKGKTLGDQDGFDEAYPLAYEVAYEPAFDQGSEEGAAQGLIDGGEEGYSAGWTTGLDAGEDVGFLAGADIYVAGGKLSDLDLSAYLTAYSSSLAAPESITAIPEPTSLCLGFLGLTLAMGQFRNRQKS